MGRPQHGRLTLMPEKSKVYMREKKRRSIWQAAEELERQAKKTKGLAHDAMGVDENEEEEKEKDDGSEDETCVGILSDGNDDEEERVREGNFEEALFKKAYPSGYPYHGLSFAFKWTNEPIHLNPGSVREYDRRAYARVSPTIQPPCSKDEGQTKMSPPEYPEDLPVLGSWCCGKVDCKIHEHSSRKFQESKKFRTIQGKIIRMLHRSRLSADG
ncbi:hypothetical protein EAF00_001740 [Botryotinia globosa]|nr:hypothetical protein EAF00_001740 [Botryotinia globosa]